MTKHFSPNQTDQIAAEARLEAAVQRLDNAANPFTKAFGRLGVWAARNDATDSAEHVDMVGLLRTMEQQSEQPPVQQ
jgi:hypothetical protein